MPTCEVSCTGWLLPREWSTGVCERERLVLFVGAYLPPEVGPREPDRPVVVPLAPPLTSRPPVTVVPTVPPAGEMPPAAVPPPMPPLMTPLLAPPLPPPPPPPVFPLLVVLPSTASASIPCSLCFPCCPSLFHSQMDKSLGRKMISRGMAYTSNSNKTANTSNSDGSSPASQAKGARKITAKKVEYKPKPRNFDSLKFDATPRTEKAR